MAKTLLIAIPLGLATTLAALSGAHWWITLEGQPDAIRYGAAIGSVFVSLLAFQLAYMAGKGFPAVCFVACAVFFTADAYQNALGYQTVSGLTVSGDVDAAKVRLDAARADLAAAQNKSAAVKMEKAQCVCPQTKRENREAFDTEMANARLDIAAAEKQVTAAKADLTAATTPKAKDTYVLAAMALIQFALSLTFMALGKGRKSEPVTVQAEHQEPATQENVVRFLRPARMNEKDMRVWGKIAKV